MQRRFRPGLIPTLLFIPMLLLFIRLGIWQLDRAEEKQQVLEQYQAMAQMAPLTALPAGGSKRLDIHSRKIAIRGYFIAEKSFLHDNQVHQGKVGYHILTPFRDLATDRVVLVNRGWVAMPYLRRDIMPDTSVQAGEVVIHGTIYLPAEQAISFDTQGAVGQAWPKVIQTILPHELEKDLQLELSPYWILLEDSENKFGEYIRDWKLVASSPEKSVSYAMQWFSFATVLVILYIALNFRRQD